MAHLKNINIDGLALSISQDDKGITIEVLRRQDDEYLGSMSVWQEPNGTRLVIDGGEGFDTLIPLYNHGD